MLRALVICPDAEMAEKLDAAFGETGRVAVVREVDRYPNALELVRLVRAHAPQFIVLSVETVAKALELVETVERETPGMQVVAINRSLDPQVMLDMMRVGVREFIALPFPRAQMHECLSRVEEQVAKKPPSVNATEYLFTFLPSKAGVGTSTVALNSAMALSRQQNGEVLLMDMDLTSGILSFMLKLPTTHSVVDAAENAHHLDDNIWPQIVTKVGQLDLIPAGRMNPEFRIESSQVRHIIDFARRHYKAICIDLSGNLERYSIELMHESKRIFLVCTPEIPSLFLAREKLNFLTNLDLGDRVSVLLNRAQKRSLVSPAQIEGLLGVPVLMSFPNDYQGVHRALQLGKPVDPGSDLGKQFATLAASVKERPKEKETEKSKRFVDYLGIMPKVAAR